MIYTASELIIILQALIDKSTKIEASFPSSPSIPRKHGDYLLSARSTDSVLLTSKKAALRKLVETYMKMPEGMTSEDAAMMDSIDAAVQEVRAQRMADYLK